MLFIWFTLLWMKKTRIFRLLKILLIVAMLVVGWLLYDKLPAQIPTHWNAQGVIDGYGSKWVTLIGLPALGIFLMLLFHFLPKRDPRKQNYASFATAWEVLQLMILWFFTYIYFVILYIVLHPAVAIMPWMLGWMGVLFFVLWFAMRHLKSNYFVGIKTPWTLESEVVWDKTHKLGSWIFMGAWIVFFVNAFWSAYFVPVFLIVIILCVLVPVGYSYVVYKRLK